jgi:nucleotide-binding universal stress UspA family protein
MYRKILVANDGSPGALKALAAAIETAKRDGAALHMVTVEELPRFPATIDEAEEEKAEANHRLLPVIEAARAQAQAAGVALETHLVPGHPVHAIIALVNDQQFELLVVGFMGHTRLRADHRQHDRAACALGPLCGACGEMILASR